MVLSLPKVYRDLLDLKVYKELEVYRDSLEYRVYKVTKETEDFQD
jgi:hypothetical protein